jgi:hypothetical protein
MKWPWSLCLSSLLLFHPQPRLTPHLPLPNLGKSLRSSPTSAPCPCYSCRGNALGMGHIGPQWIIFTGSQCWKKILKLSWFLQMTNWLQIIQIVCVYIYIYNIDTHTHFPYKCTCVHAHYATCGPSEVFHQVHGLTTCTSCPSSPTQWGSHCAAWWLILSTSLHMLRRVDIYYTECRSLWYSISIYIYYSYYTITILYYTMLYYTILCYTILFTILYYTWMRRVHKCAQVEQASVQSVHFRNLKLSRR